MESLKSRLKQVSLLRAANARLKASALRFDRKRLARGYERRASQAGIVYDRAAVAGQVAARLRARGIDPSAIPERPGVLWVGADLHQDRGGFLQSLERHAEVTSFYRPDGTYGIQVKSADGAVRQRDPDVVAMNDAQLLRLVRERLASGPPLHMVLGQMWAHLISPQALAEVQSLGVMTVNVSMDDRLPALWKTWHGHRLGSPGLAGSLDLVLTTSPETCLWYAVEGCPALWWPLASDPGVFAPAPEDAKIHDVSFVGSRYGVRAQLVEALEAAGIQVSAFGPGWPKGPVPADQVAQIFAESRIILGSGTIAHNRSVYTIKLRDFDATMAGALYLTHRNPDLLQLFEEGREIELYETPEELVRKARHYLAHPAERIAVSARARERAMRDHTWDVRLAELFATIRGTTAASPNGAPR